MQRPENACRLVSALLAALVGFLSPDAAAQSSVTLTVPGTSDPFLAGQPAGTTTHADTAPAQSPPQVMIALCGSAVLHFTNETGLCDYAGGPPTFPPEGATSSAGTNPDLGISGVTAPVCALLGVFLSDGTNTGGSLPPNLSFDSAALRDFPTLAPLIGQLFFVGDGLRNDLTTVQDFVVPTGATRLFLGILDGYGWYNNTGSFDVTVSVASASGVCGGSTILGPGCGPETLVLSSNTPASAYTLTVSLGSNLPTTAGALGFTQPTAAPIALGSGCLVYLDLPTLTTIPLVTDVVGSWSVSVGLPPPPGLAGAHVALQAALVDAAAPLGVSLSNGILLTIGG